MNPRRCSIADPHPWKTQYDGHGRVLKEIDADGNYLEYTYGNGGLTTLTTDGTVVKETKFYASGGSTVHRHTKFTFDDLLRLEKREAMAKLSPTGGNLGDGWQTSTYEYDLAGRTTKVFDDRSKYVQFTYDDLGRLTARVHETGNKVEFDYVDQTGLVEKRTLTENVPGSSQKVTDEEYTYDDLGRMILHRDPENNPTTIIYNFAGQVLTHKDPLSNLVNHTYDRRGAKLQTVVQAPNLTTVQTVSFSYTDAGLLEEATDGAGKKTEYEYDDRGRLKKR
jgi:YD repeat-containing protein